MRALAAFVLLRSTPLKGLYNQQPFQFGILRVIPASVRFPFIALQSNTDIKFVFGKYYRLTSTGLGKPIQLPQNSGTIPRTQYLTRSTAPRACRCPTAPANAIAALALSDRQSSPGLRARNVSPQDAMATCTFRSSAARTPGPTAACRRHTPPAPIPEAPY